MNFLITMDVDTDALHAYIECTGYLFFVYIIEQEPTATLAASPGCLKAVCFELNANISRQAACY